AVSAQSRPTPRKTHRHTTDLIRSGGLSFILLMTVSRGEPYLQSLSQGAPRHSTRAQRCADGTSQWVRCRLDDRATLPGPAGAPAHRGGLATSTPPYQPEHATDDANDDGHLDQLPDDAR